ncbi:MAG: hypothetical protein GXP29_12845 [Planctomycetes bacterium]|nr:hypothetical protein [Planctomycetota bacterium]
METQAPGAIAGSTPVAPASSATKSLGGEDFFKLLIAQLTNQDPLEPTSNQDLLNQISSIRDIELSTDLSSSLKSLTSQQRFSSASGLIGRFVTGQPGEDGAAAVKGVVTSIRFDAEGKAVLELEGGDQLPLDRISAVMDAERAAESFVNQFVTGVNRDNPEDPRVVEGIVTGRSTDSKDRVVLELDSGDNVLLRDVVSSDPAKQAE